MANQPINLKINNVPGTTSITGTLSIVNCDTLQVITVAGYTFQRQFTTTGVQLGTGITVEFTNIPENVVIPANHKVKVSITTASGVAKVGYGTCQTSAKAVCIVPTTCNISIRGFSKVSNTEFNVRLNSSAVGPFSVLIKKNGETKLSRTGLTGTQVGVIQPFSQNIVFEAWKSGEVNVRRKLFDFDEVATKPITDIISETSLWTIFALVRVPFDKYVFKVTRPDSTSFEKTFIAGYISGERRVSWQEENHGEVPKIGNYTVNLKLFRDNTLVLNETSTLTISADVTNNVPVPENTYEIDRNYTGGTLEEVPTGQDYNGVPFKRSQAPVLDGLVRLAPRVQGNFYEFDEQTGKNIFLTQRFPKNFTVHPKRPFGWMGPFAKDLIDRRTLLNRGVTHFGRLDKALELNLPSSQIIAYLFGSEVSDAKSVNTAAYQAALQLEAINPTDNRVASLKKYGLQNYPDANLGAYVYLGKYLYNRYVGQVGGTEIPYFTINLETYEGGSEENFHISQFGIQKGIIERARELGHATTNLTYGSGAFIITANPIANGQLGDNYFVRPSMIWGSFTNEYSQFAQSSKLYQGRDQYIRATWDETSLFQKNPDGSLKLGTNGRHLYVTGARDITVFGVPTQVTSNESQHYADSLYSEMESILANWRYSTNTSLDYDGSQIIGQMPYPEGTGNLRPSISEVKHTSLFRDSTEGLSVNRDLSNNGALLPEPLNWDQRPVNKKMIESTLLARRILNHAVTIWSYRFNPQWEWGKPEPLGDKTSLGQFEIMLKANHRSQNFPELFDLMDSGKIDFIIPKRFIYKGNEVKGDYVYEKPIVWFLKEKGGRRMYAYWVWPVQDIGTEHERDMKFWIELQNGTKTQSYSFKFKNREAGFERFLLPVGFEGARSQDCYFQFKSLINETITWRGNYNYVAPANTVAPPLYNGTAVNNPVEEPPTVDNAPPATPPVIEDSSYLVPTNVDQWPLIDNRNHPTLGQIGEYVKLQNELVEVRLWKKFGGAICHISMPNSGNMINNSDLGRQVNHALYRGGLTSPNPSAVISSFWATPEGGGVGNNPIASGNFYDDYSIVQKLSFIPNGVYMEVQMRNWAVDEEITDVVMQQWVRLIGREIKVNLKFVNARTGDTVSYPARQQELPCIYIVKEWFKTAYYDGSEPFKGLPLTFITDGNMIPHTISENFIAMLNSQDEGLGITSKRLYRVTNEEFDGTGGEFGNGATYIAGAPLLNISHNEIMTHEYSIVVGHINQIREIVATKARIEKPVFRFDSVNNRNDWQFEKGFEDYSWPIPNTGWRIKAKTKQLKIVSCPVAIKPVDIEKLYIRFAVFGTITAFKFGWDQIRETAIQSATVDHSINFTAIPDGVYRTIEINLKASGKLTDIVSSFWIHYQDYAEAALADTEGFSILWINTVDADPLGSFVPTQSANPCNFSHLQVIGKWGSDDILAVNFANQWWVAHRVIVNGRDAFFIRGTNFLTRNDVITTFGTCVSSFAGGTTDFDGIVPPASFTTPVGYTKYNTADGNTYYQTGLIA